MDGKFCQSCGMPLMKPEDFGTEKNGEANAEYCFNCWKDGAFSEWARDITLVGMIEFCAKLCFEQGFYKTLEESETVCKNLIPQLKRWVTA